MALEKLAGKTKIVASKVVASPQGTPGFLPHRGGPLPLPADAPRLRRLRGREEDNGSCRVDLFGRAACAVLLVAEEETFQFESGAGIAASQL
jgi:hypothetical protein